jgi:hypothetical protein
VRVVDTATQPVASRVTSFATMTINNERALSDALQTLDPQLLAAIQNEVQSKMAEAEQSYRQEIQARDVALQRHEQERKAQEAALQARVLELSNELVAAKAQSGCVPTFLLARALFHLCIIRNRTVVDADSQMDYSELLGARHSEPPGTRRSEPPGTRQSEPPAQNLNKGRASRQRQLTPDSAPSRNLRSSKRPAVAGGPAATVTLPAERSRATVTTKPPKKDKPTTKPASHVHRLLPSELPDDIGGLQVRRFVCLVIVKKAHELIEGDEYSYTRPLGLT